MSIKASCYRGFDVDVIRTGEHRRLLISNPETGEIIHDGELNTPYWYPTAKSLIDGYLGGQPDPEAVAEVESVHGD